MRTYDSGFQRPFKTLILDGIATLLAPTLRVNGGFIAEIMTYPYVMNQGDDGDVGLMEQIVGTRSPVYAVAVGDFKAKRAGAAGNYMGDLDVEVYAVTTHNRSAVEGRLTEDVAADLDLSADPGIFAMNQLAMMYLSDQYPYAEKTSNDGSTIGNGAAKVPIGGKIKELRLAGDRHLITTEELTIWGVQFSLGVELQANMLRGATQLLTSIVTSHRFDGGKAPDPTVAPLVVTSDPAP